MNDRLYRSRDDRIIAGVAGGLAEQYRLDPSLVRIIWAVLILPTGGLALLLYVLMAFIVPEEPAGDARWAAWDRGPMGEPWTDPSTGQPPLGPLPMDVPASSTTAGTDVGQFGSSATAGAAFAGMPSSPDPTGTGPTAGLTGPTSGSTTTSSDGPLGAPAGIFPPAGAGLSGQGPATDARVAREQARHARQAARAERREWRREHRDPMGALLFGLVLILVGGFFLVRAYIPAFDAGQAWPILLVIIGLVLLVGSVRRQSPPSA